jgi:hypothetical protein
MNHIHGLLAAMVREEKSEHAQKGEARTHEARSTARKPTNETRKTTLHNPDRRNEFFIEVQNKITIIHEGHRPPSHI